MRLTVSPAARRIAAEAVGTATLVAAVVGSGIMATRLSTDIGVQLLINAVSTVTALGVLIWALGPISGAHFNPAVTVVAAARGEMRRTEAASYVIAQVLGALLGTVTAHLMFTLPAAALSTKARTGPGQWLGEVIATAGLVALIGVLTRTGQTRPAPALVAAWIGSAYFFTSSTSFANPAVTIGRSITDTFTGIAPIDAPGFIAAQLVGAAVGAGLVELFYPRPALAEPATHVG